MKGERVVAIATRGYNSLTAGFPSGIAPRVT
jgi:hypothetical protein